MSPGVLASERPGDLSLAWKEMKKRGSAWVKKAKGGLAALKKISKKDYLSFLE